MKQHYPWDLTRGSGPRRRRRANIVELLSVSLKFQGFEVHTATNGPGLDQAREARPDAVILDVMMPGMDGFGVLRRLRADGIERPRCS